MKLSDKLNLYLNLYICEWNMKWNPLSNTDENTLDTKVWKEWHNFSASKIWILLDGMRYFLVMLQAKNVFVLAVSYFVDRSMKARLEIDNLDYSIVIIFCGSFIFTLSMVIFTTYTAKFLFHQPTIGTVTTQWLDSDGLVTVVNCWQHCDTLQLIKCAVTVLLADVNSDHTVTVQSLCLVDDWWNRSFAVYRI